MQDLIHRQKFTIRGYDAGMQMKANPLSIIKILHDAAVDQVIELGFSALQLDPRNLAWVLAQQYLEIFHYPKLGEEVEVVTFPSGVEKAFTYRDYYMYSSKGRLITQASTSWILMNTALRKISAFPPDIDEILQGTSTLDHLPRPPAIHMPDKNSDAGNSRNFQASFFDVDFNNHVSNHYFFRWMLDSIPINYLSNYRLRSLNVKFRGEAYAGELITADAMKINEASWEHLLLKAGKTIAHGISEWV